jgi:hypothetical protein
MTTTTGIPVQAPDSRTAPSAGRGIERRRYPILTEYGNMKEASQGSACRQRDVSLEAFKLT